jgi:hypothetical protein
MCTVPPTGIEMICPGPAGGSTRKFPTGSEFAGEGLDTGEGAGAGGGVETVVGVVGAAEVLPHATVRMGARMKASEPSRGCMIRTWARPKGV